MDRIGRCGLHQPLLGWYAQSGEIDKGAAVLNQEIDGLYAALKKPIIVSEFGVDTFPGMHARATRNVYGGIPERSH